MASQRNVVLSSIVDLRLISHRHARITWAVSVALIGRGQGLNVVNRILAVSFSHAVLQVHSIARFV